MKVQRFAAELVQEDGKVRLYVPFDPTSLWGRATRHRIEGTIGGIPFAGSLGSRGGRFFVPINKALQAGIGTWSGQRLAITMMPALGEAAEDVPADFVEALAKDAEARAFFDGLSAFYRGTYLKWITSAKRESTRAARVGRAIARLRVGEKHAR